MQESFSTSSRNGQGSLRTPDSTSDESEPDFVGNSCTKPAPIKRRLARTKGFKMASSDNSDQPGDQPQPQPSPFQWVTITDPQQARDKDTMRNVRAHVMNDYLHKEQKNPHSTDARVRNADKKRKHLASSTQPTPERRHSTQADPVAGPSNWWSTTPSSSSGDLASSISPREASEAGGFALQRHAPTLAIQTNVETANISRRRSDTLSALVPRRGLRITDRIPYDMAFSRAYGLADMSARLDPFPAEPRFENREIDVENLKRSCSFYFGSEAMNKKWVPLMLQSRRSFLSTLCISTAYVDILHIPPIGSNTRPIGSLRTDAVFEEIIRLLNISFADPETRTDDSSIIAVVQVLCGEMMVAEDLVLQIHEQGLWSMVLQRGGLCQLGGNGAIADTLAITNFNLAIFREAQPRHEYLAYAQAIHTAIPESRPGLKLPESPLYCPFGGYYTISRSRTCSQATLDVVKWTRDLTDISLKIHKTQRREMQYAGPQAADHTQALEQRSNLISRILALLPDDSGDNTYESVRLCARLYASAIWQKCPLSLAAHPNASLLRTNIADCGVTPLMIKEALIKAEIHEAWNSMIGVLFWITLVAGAACNTVPYAPPRRASIGVGNMHAENLFDEEEVTRKWLIAVGLRCSVLLSFEHTAAVVQMLRKLLDVQDMLADRA